MAQVYIRDTIIIWTGDHNETATLAYVITYMTKTDTINLFLALAYDIRLLYFIVSCYP